MDGARMIYTPGFEKELLHAKHNSIRPSFRPLKVIYRYLDCEDLHNSFARRKFKDDGKEHQNESTI